MWPEARRNLVFPSETWISTAGDEVEEMDEDLCGACSLIPHPSSYSRIPPAVVLSIWSGGVQGCVSGGSWPPNGEGRRLQSHPGDLLAGTGRGGGE